MADREAGLELQPQHWWGWNEQPYRLPGWGASPIFLCALTPCRTGRGELELRFIEVVRPRHPTMRTLTLRIQLHRPELIVGTYKDDDGTIRAATIAHCTPDWLRSNCAALLQARPPRWEHLAANGNWKSSTYLKTLFGENQAQIASGDVAARYPKPWPTPPAAQSLLTIDLILSPWHAGLVSIGFKPCSMDDRWLIHMTGSVLHLRRSWTGCAIFTANTCWQGGSLHIAQLLINRDPAQHTGTSDEEGLFCFRQIVAGRLLGEPTG